jgi:hypothetical protein
MLINLKRRLFNVQHDRLFATHLNLALNVPCFIIDFVRELSAGFQLKLCQKSVGLIVVEL